MLRLLLLLGTTLACAGCTTTSPMLDGSEWTLLRAETPDGALTPEAIAPDADAPTLLFDGDRIAGSDGCNQFSGSFEATGDGFTTSQLAATKRACPPPVDALSRAVLGTLDAGTVTSEVDGDELRLSANGTVLVYTRR